MRRSAAAAALVAALGAAVAAHGGGVERVQAEGAAALPAWVPGDPPPAPPSAAELRSRRERAVADGLERAVLALAVRFAAEEARADEERLRAALGAALADYTLGHGVLADLGEREPAVEVDPDAPPPPPRKPTDPIPREHAFRIEALIDAERVMAALRAAGVALGSPDGAADALEVVVEAPYDAAGLAALRARLAALGAERVVPRRYSAERVVLSVTGLALPALAQRLGAEPPPGYEAEALPDEAARSLHVRLRPLGRAPSAAAAAPSD